MAERRKFLLFVMLIGSLLAVIFTVIQLNKKDLSYEDADMITDKIANIGIRTGWEADLLSVSDWLTDGCIEMYYPEFSRSSVDSQISKINEETDKQRELSVGHGGGVSFREGMNALLSKEITLDSKRNRGIVLLTWDNNGSVYYTVLYFHWNDFGKIDTLQYVVNAMFYGGGFS